MIWILVRFVLSLSVPLVKVVYYMSWLSWQRGPCIVVVYKEGPLKHDQKLVLTCIVYNNVFCIYATIHLMEVLPAA